MNQANQLEKLVKILKEKHRRSMLEIGRITRNLVAAENRIKKMKAYLAEYDNPETYSESFKNVSLYKNLEEFKKKLTYLILQEQEKANQIITSRNMLLAELNQHEQKYNMLIGLIAKNDVKHKYWQEQYQQQFIDGLVSIKHELLGDN